MPSARLAASILVIFLTLPASAQVTGTAVPEMAHYDAAITQFIESRGIPGAAVAVSKDGRLVYARGFGLADVDAGEAVQPDSRFRIASIAKPVTAVAVMRLVEAGMLDLDEPAFALLPDLPPEAGVAEDPRLADVTVRDLLQHSGGWDRDGTGYDPMFDVVNIAAEMGEASPADCETIIRYMRGRPLDFDPGSRYSYSNFGYCVLGSIIEHVTGETYESYARGVLADAGIEDMELGHSLLEDRLPGEVRYYPLDPAVSVFDGSAASWPYGGFHLEAMDAHGGWVASAVDLLRFTAALDGSSDRPDLLAPASMQEMSSKPDVSTWNGSNSWYGLGWSVNTNGHWWHNGSLPGLESLLVRSNYQGLHWAVLLNHRPANASPHLAAIDQLMWELALDVQSWPSHDLFQQFVATETLSRQDAALELSAPFPNPATGVATFEVTLPKPAGVRVELYDVLGRRLEVMSDAYLQTGVTPVNLDVGSLRPGLYFVRATTTNGTTAGRTVTVVR